MSSASVVRRLSRPWAFVSLVLLAFCAHGQVPGGVAEKQHNAPPRGLADSQVALQNGAFTSSVRIDLPAFRSITPTLRLGYSSSGGNEFAGVGWDLFGFSSIERVSPGRGSPPTSFNTSAYLLDGEELIPSTALGGTHATLRQSYLRIQQGTNWTVTRPDGAVMTYTPIFNPGNGAVRWGLSKVRDIHGSEVTYAWFCDQAPSGQLGGGGTRNCYPGSISYAGVVVTINRETRPDIPIFATGASLAAQRHRLKSISVTVNGVRRNSYVLSYALSVRTGRSLLTKVQQFGRDGVTGLPPTTIAYRDAPSGFDTFHPVGSNYGLGSINWTLKNSHIHDFNGDGRKDVLLHGGLNSKTQILYGNATGGFQQPVDISNQYGMSSAQWDMGIPTFGDFNGDGRTDIVLRVYPVWVTTEPKPWSVHLLLSDSAGGFRNQQVITNSYGLQIKHWEYSPLLVADYNGDGKDDILLQYKPPYSSNLPNPARAYMLYGNTGNNGFENFADDVTNDGGMTPQLWFDNDVIPADFNGDGLADLYMKNENGGAYPNFHSEIRIVLSRRSGDQFSIPQSIYGMFGVAGAQWSNYGVYLGDYNGDGRTDFLFHRRISSSSVYPTGIIYSQGSDAAATMFSTLEDITTKSGMTRSLWESADLTIADFNNDGISDILVKRTSNIGGNRAYVLHSNGSGYRNAVDASALYGLTEDDWAKSRVHVGDFNGDGDQDLFLKPIAPQATPQARVLASSGVTGNVAHAISNGYGGVTNIVYEPSSHWANSNNPPISQTVSALEVLDGRGGSSTTVYDYAGGAWDPIERRHLGYRYVKTIDPTDAFTETYFYQGASFAQGEVEDFYEKNESGLTMRRKHRVVSGSAAAPWVRHLAQEDNYECNGDASCRQSRKSYAYDGYGNTTTATEHGDVLVTGDERTTITTFFPNTALYITGLPATVAVRAGAGATGTLLSQSVNYYDGAASSSTPPGRGNLTRVEQRKDAAGAFTQRNFGYDAYGNQTSETDHLGNTTTTAWGTAFGLYPSVRTNPLQHATTLSWEPVCGLQVGDTDANGAATTWTYDNFCRRSQETRADGGHTQWFYVDHGTGNQHVREEVRDGTSDDLWNVTYFDGLGRVYRRLAEGGSTVDTSYNHRDQILSVSAPFASGETPRLTAYTYDAVGRTTRITRPDGSLQQFLHDDWSVTTCDELGKPRSQYRDAYGQVVLVREYIGKSCQVAPAGVVGTDIFETRTTFDLLGKQIGVTDAKGHVTTYVYDMLGRRLQSNDPDMGLWHYGYDDNGNLASQTDAKGVTLVFSYDALNRITQKRHISGGVLASYFYDEPDHGYGIGRLSRVNYYRGALWYNYDAMGRVTDQYRQIGLPIMVNSATNGAPPPGSVNVYHARSTYDFAGRLHSVQYPTGEVVTNGYDAAGRLVQVGGYVTNATYDARGNLLTRTLGNGVVERFEYDANRFWLTRSRAEKAGVLHNIAYGRNVRGEVTSRGNALVPEDQWTFAYDDLRRLTNAMATGNPNWSQDFVYDAIGRMLSQTGVGDYTYPKQGFGPVHAPTGVSKKSIPPIPFQVISYDANGRMTQGEGANISYDYEGRAVVISDEVFGYDASGELVTQNGLRFFSNLYEEDLGLSLKTNYYYFGETRIARNRGGAVHYYHGDQIGSASAMTDAAGVVVARKTFSPFGRQLLRTGSLSDDVFGLAAQRVESNGLYHMGARRMAPRLGVFVMPDPSGAPDPTRPQSLNRFAYAANSPVNLIDPTGYSEEEPGWSDKMMDVIAGVWQQTLNNAAHTAWTNDPACDRIGCSAGESYSLEGAGFPLYQPYGRAENPEVQLGRDLTPAVNLVPALALRSPRLAIREGRFSLWKRADFNGTRVYQRNDLIDPGYVDARGRTNLDRMRSGLAPIGPDGKTMNLHHMLQSNDSPLAEMTQTFHQKNSAVIHINPNTIESGIDRRAFDTFRSQYWKERSKGFEVPE